MIKMIKNKWVYIPSILAVFLVIFQAGTSWYRTGVAEKFVSSIHGVQVRPIDFYDEDPERDVHADIYIRWSYTPFNPPSCPVTLVGIFKHESGLALTDSPIDNVDTATFKAIHSTKNGRTGVEPVYSQDVSHLIKENPGVWQYQIAFKFHCSLVNSEWISFIKFDEQFRTRPVILTVTEDNND